MHPAKFNMFVMVRFKRELKYFQDLYLFAEPRIRFSYNAITFDNIEFYGSHVSPPFKPLKNGSDVFFAFNSVSKIIRIFYLLPPCKSDSGVSCFYTERRWH